MYIDCTDFTKLVINIFLKYKKVSKKWNIYIYKNRIWAIQLFVQDFQAHFQCLFTNILKYSNVDILYRYYIDIVTELFKHYT